MLILCGEAGQTLRALAAPQPQFSARARHVEVYATVTDARGSLVKGLTKDEFMVTEDGRPQEVTAFFAGELPLAVALAVDRSFSISPQQLRQQIAAARAFISSLGPDDRVMLLSVGSGVEVLAPLSRDRAAPLAALATLDSWGTTPLYDAAVQAIDAIQSAAGRRALILVSDGRDRESRTTAAELIAHARRTDVLVYPIALGRDRPPVFAELATVTGGRSSHVNDAQTLERTLRTIGDELRFQYLLGYTPTRPEPPAPEWRAIGVTVLREAVRVRARDGYFTR